MVNSEEFTKRLEKIFDYYGLNASAFAEKIDVGRASISHLLSGRNKPSLDFVMRVVKTFPEVELYWLLNGKGQFPKSDAFQDHPITKVSEKNRHDSTEIEEPKTESESKIASNDIERIVIFFKNGKFKTYSAE